MKKTKNFALGTLTLLGSALGCLSKNKAVRIGGFVVSGVSAGLLLKDLWKKEKAVVEKQCQETEKKIEQSGLDIEKIEHSVDLLENEGKEEVYFGQTLLLEIYKSCVLDDDMLTYSRQDFLGTLHIMQSEDRDEVIVCIPLPNKGRTGISPGDIRAYFKEFYEEWVDEHKIDLGTEDNQVFLDHIFVCVGREIDPDEDDGYGYMTYQTVLKEEGEVHRDYMNRMNEVIELWARGDRDCREKYKVHEGSETLGFEQYLLFKLPVYPSGSKLTGLDLISATTLVKDLMELHEIPLRRHDDSVNWQFNRVLFHPGEDLGRFYQIENNKLKTIDLV